MDTKIIILLMLYILHSLCSGVVGDMNYGLLWKYPLESVSSTVYDLNKDSIPEIISGSADSGVYIFNATGWPICEFKSDGSIVSSPVVADLDDDGVPEIIFGSQDSYLYVINSSCNFLWRFKSDGSIVSSPVVADLDDDGVPEIIFGSQDSYLYILSGSRLRRRVKTLAPIDSSPIVTSLNDRMMNDILFGSRDNVVYAINDLNGIILNYLTKGDIISTPDFEDIDRDGRNEIIIGSCDSRLYCLEYGERKIDTGKECTRDGCYTHYISNPYLRETWNFSIDRGCFYSPVVSDLYGDRKFEIVVGSSDKNLYILDSEGNLSLKYTLNYPVNSKPVIGDLNGDGEKEIIFVAGNSVYAINYSGYSLWNYKVSAKIQTNPVIADLNGDNRPELVIGSDALYVFGPMDDSDNDSILDFYETLKGLNPMKNDTDGDGLMDPVDPHPLEPESMFLDSDNDGLSDYKEFRIGTNPELNDTDGDGFIDSIDPHPNRHELFFIDSDNDGLNDYMELKIGTDPELNDTDRDGIIDSVDHDPLKRVKSINNNTGIIEQNLQYGQEKMTNVSNSTIIKRTKSEGDALFIYISVIPFLLIIYFLIQRMRDYYRRSVLKEKRLVEWEEYDALEMRRIAQNRG